MPWWQSNHLRLIQLNLRDVDAAMDVEDMVGQLADFGANAVMVGAGGITSFYPTKLPYQTPSPFGKRDMLGQIVAKCHEKGIRVIARFDFSKTHERLFTQHPDWYYQSAKGEAMRFNDTVQTCVCGAYQQQLSLTIIEEVLRRENVDGIFFNMFGFQTRDYSGRQFGPCHCAACREKYLAFSGKPLPEAEGEAVYTAFKEQVVGELLGRIHDLVKSINPEVAICTYHYKDVDIVREESNSAVDRPLPFWLYSASENVAAVEGSWEEKIISNCVINATDIFYRFMGVSKYLTRLRLYESLAAGSGLDWCIIGRFADYPDRDNFAYVREVFHYHQQHERYYGHMDSRARVLLVRPTGGKNNKEYLGLFKLLKEEHILFDVICNENAPAAIGRMDRYAALLSPGQEGVSQALLAAALDRGVFVLLTGWTQGEPGPVGRRIGLTGLRPRPATRAAYLCTQEKDVFTSFPKRDWVFLEGPLGEAAGGGRRMLPLVREAMYGPPERCYGHELSSICGAVAASDGSCAALLFRAGELYYQLGYVDHRKLVCDLLDTYCPAARSLRTNAPDCVEIFVDGCGEGETLVQLVNLSGFNGITVGAPIPIHDITLEIALDQPPKAVKPLGDAGAPEYTWAQGRLYLSFAPLQAYQAFVVEEAP